MSGGIKLIIAAAAFAGAFYLVRKALHDATDEIADGFGLDDFFPEPRFSLSPAREDCGGALGSPGGPAFSCICEPTGECEHVWGLAYVSTNRGGQNGIV